MQEKNSALMSKKNILTTFFFFALFSLGYIRETVFVVINSVLNNIGFPYNKSYVTPPAFLYEMSSSEILTLKWGLTLGFALLFLAATSFIIYRYFKTFGYVKITIVLYTSIALLAGLSMLVGYIINDYENTYPLARFLMGLLQYPLFSVVLFVLFFYSHNSAKLKKQ